LGECQITLMLVVLTRSWVGERTASAGNWALAASLRRKAWRCMHPLKPTRAHPMLSDRELVDRAALRARPRIRAGPQQPPQKHCWRPGFST